jgi:Do/DeqQ family serine protease
MKRFGLLIIFGIGLIVGSLLTQYYSSVEKEGEAKSTPPLETLAEKPRVPPERKLDVSLDECFSEIAAKIKPAVVNIAAKRRIRDFSGDNFFDFFWEKFFPHTPRQVQNLGSGFIFKSSGYILTNNHVIKGAEEIIIKLSDEREFKGKVVGRDPKTDIAVIKIDTKSELPTVPLGNSDEVRVGQWALAIGNPFGFERTLTIGVISATGRSLGLTQYEDFIQTDASLNQGNSGGPLVNIKGEVIGINTAIKPFAAGIGFAIPINMVKEILPELLKHGKVTRGWLGVYIRTLTPGLASTRNLRVTKGVLIIKVLANTPAARAGLQENDVIVKVNNKPVETARALQRIIAKIKPGEKVTFSIYRGRWRKRITVKISQMPEEEPPPLAQEFEEFEFPDIGIEVAEREDKEGVVVTKVIRGSKGWKAGLKKGDIILEIDNHKVDSVESYKRILYQVRNRSRVLLTINRRTRILLKVLILE